MPVCKLADRLGHTMDLYIHEKKPWHLGAPSFNFTACENMPELALREDDILLCSYPKSGCHWVWEITRMIIGGTTHLDDVNKELFMLEFSGNNSDVSNLPSPRILNNHQHFDNQPKDLLLKKNKIIFVYRNPRDVAVSYYYHQTRLPGYNFTGPNFTSYLPRFADGLVDHESVFDYLKGWERAIKDHNLDVCLLCYEDLQEDPLPSVKRLSSFLNKNHGEDFLQKVIQATHIDNMRDAKKHARKDVHGSVFYRKGKVGDWKNHFTVAESEWFSHLIRTKMAASELFKFRYEIC